MWCVVIHGASTCILLLSSVVSACTVRIAAFLWLVMCPVDCLPAFPAQCADLLRPSSKLRQWCFAGHCEDLAHGICTSIAIPQSSGFAQLKDREHSVEFSRCCQQSLLNFHTNTNWSLCSCVSTMEYLYHLCRHALLPCIVHVQSCAIDQWSGNVFCCSKIGHRRTQGLRV